MLIKPILILSLLNINIPKVKVLFQKIYIIKDQLLFYKYYLIFVWLKNFFYLLPFKMPIKQLLEYDLDFFLKFKKVLFLILKYFI